MTLIVLLWLIGMLIVSGVAIDLARAEHMRVRVQNTLDRAVLAASDIDQTLDPKSVVLDYFAKANLSKFIDPDEIVVDEFPGTRRKVSAVARAYVGTSTLQLSEIDRLGAPGAAAAEEAITDVEVMLVLDISGSMNSSNRIQNLKVAAKEFVDTVLSDPNANGEMAVGIVPFNGQVNVGNTILDYFDVDGVHSFGTCINHTTAEFSDTSLDPDTDVLQRADVFDPWYTSRNVTETYCSRRAGTDIVPPTNNAEFLKQRIDDLVANGNTSIDIGTKWGSAMLDPDFRSIYASLANNGVIPTMMAERPYDFDKPDTAKYLIVMSDGENTDEYLLRDAFRNGLSPIYRNSSGALSIFHERSNTTSDYYRLNSDNSGSWSTSPWSGSIQLTWPEVWEKHPIRFIVQQLYDDPLGWSNSTRDNFITTQVRTVITPQTKDERLSSICTETKQAGVTVYTIAFEAPPAGVNALHGCATTSQSHFFDVAGTDISTAFQIIARRISELKLTQ